MRLSVNLQSRMAAGNFDMQGKALVVLITCLVEYRSRQAEHSAKCERGFLEFQTALPTLFGKQEPISNSQMLGIKFSFQSPKLGT